jgi:meiotic recombination protein SPO11
MLIDFSSQVAAAKGLVAGSFSVIRKDKSMVDYSAEPEGILTPNSKEIEDIQPDDVRWILVIEKEV